MSGNQKKVLAVAGGACSIAAGYAAYKRAKKWELGSAANIVGGVLAYRRALLA